MTTLLLKSSSDTDIELIQILATKLGIESQRINDVKDIHISELHTKENAKHNFFDSLGLWKDRDIDAKSLRYQAWKIQE